MRQAIDWHSAFTGNLLDVTSVLSSNSLEKLGIPGDQCISLQDDHGDFHAIVDHSYLRGPMLNLPSNSVAGAT